MPNRNSLDVSLKSQRNATAALMRKLNRSAILDLIRKDGPLSRTDIAQRLGLSLSTVVRIMDSLLDEDLIFQLDDYEVSGGRPRPLLSFNGKGYRVIGIDLGGTKFFAALAGLSGDVQHEVFADWTSDNPEENLQKLFGLIDHLLSLPHPGNQKIRGIGVGVPGVTDTQRGIVKWAPSLGWRNLFIAEILRERYQLPVLVENDVNLAALGELYSGAGKGSSNLVCLNIGTGIGAGIILKQNIYHGFNNASGEVGYLLPGVQFLNQQYSRFGALESFASGQGIAERASRFAKEQGMDCDPEITAEKVFYMARQGSEWAQQVVTETVDYLCLAIAAITSVLDPEVVILGGGVSKSADLLIEPIQRRLSGVIPYVPRIVQSTLGYRASVMGAIALVLNETTEHIMLNLPI